MDVGINNLRPSWPRGARIANGICGIWSKHTKARPVWPCQGAASKARC